MADGSTKPIDEVRVGEKVAATDPEADGLDAKTVTATSSHRQAGMPFTTDVLDTDGTRGTKTAKVSATDEHPFWLPEKHRWADAKDLKRGDRLRTSTGAWVEITAVQHQPVGYNRVHNLTITDHHTYYVLAGDTPVVVHNCGTGEISDEVMDGHIMPRHSLT